MKKIITTIICLILIIVTFYYANPISDFLVKYINNIPTIIINDGNIYTKNKDYLLIQESKDYIPYSYQDLMNIIYSTLDHRWENFTFYCPKEYTNCLNDFVQIIKNTDLVDHIQNYVHPFNNITDINSLRSDTGEITLKIKYLYEEETIALINDKVDEIIKNNITDDMSDYDKIKTIYDYIINNTKYDVAKVKKNSDKYHSNTAYGPLYEGYGICNGYTDLMAVFLTKLGFDNYKISTLPSEINKNAGHTWNAVYYNNEWVHLDATWDDPVSNDGKDYLFHRYFLVSNEAMKEADSGETQVLDHQFNSLYYLEFN